MKNLKYQNTETNIILFYLELLKKKTMKINAKASATWKQHNMKSVCDAEVKNSTVGVCLERRQAAGVPAVVGVERESAVTEILLMKCASFFKKKKLTSRLIFCIFKSEGSGL